ncbi:MAG: hypothetical protein ACI3XP_05500 [Eubacteriales bacterium]
MKKTLAWILAALMLTGTLGACASEKKPSEDSSGAAVTGAPNSTADTEPEISDNLPEENYEGYKFRMFIRPDYGGDFWCEEETGETLNDAVYARNRAVSERFNVEMVGILSANNSGTDCLPTIQAGDDAYDMIAPHGRNAFEMVLQNVMLDWDYLTRIDLTREWWDQDARENFTVAGKLFTMIGDISYLNLGYSFAMVFNKNLFDDNNIPYPYDDVRAGKWTWDQWEEIIRDADRDLNSDGMITAADDQLGYLTHEWYGCVEFMYPAGIRVVTNDENGIPQLSFMSEKTVEVFDRYFSHIKKGSNVVTAADMFAAFSEGRVFTIDCTVAGTSNLREMEDEFGIVPWPKYSEEDEYAACINAAASLICVPVTIQDAERTSTIIEGMASESYKNLIPVYYDVVLQTKQARDKDSSEMLDIIRGSRVFDFGYYNSSIGSVASMGVTLYNASGNAGALSSFYKKAEASSAKKLNDIVEKFQTLGAEQQ